MQLGYWSVPITSADTNYTTNVDPYIPGAWPYLMQALNWAKEYGLHVILDLHGAPGSQNGYDNSGQRTPSPAWGSDDESVPCTLDIIKFIAEKLGGLVDILELLNEPLGWYPTVGGVISDYWKDGYQVVRSVMGNRMQVMIMDAFLGVQVSHCVPLAACDVSLEMLTTIVPELGRLLDVPWGTGGLHGHGVFFSGNACDIAALLNSHRLTARVSSVQLRPAGTLVVGTYRRKPPAASYEMPYTDRRRAVLMPDPDEPYAIR